MNRNLFFGLSGNQTEKDSLDTCDLLFVTNEFVPIGGGIATYSFELSSALNRLGHKTIVIAARRNAKNIAYDQKIDFPVFRTLEFKSSFFRHLHRLYVSIKVSYVCKPKILLASDWRPGLIVLIVSKIFGIPFAVSAYGSEVFLAQQNALSRWLSRYVFNKAVVIFSISQYTKELLVKFGVDSDKVKVITLGVNPDRWYVSEEQIQEIKNRLGLHEKRILLTLARLDSRKGHDIVLRALPTVLASYPNTLYVIAGKGDNEHHLRNLVSQLGLEQNVIFTGFISEEDKAPLYFASDVYVLLSRQEDVKVEGFGITLLEASACGRPVVAGKHGGVVDAVEDGRTGLLVDPHDPNEVAKTINCLLKDTDFAYELGRNGRLKVEKEANWVNVAEQTWAIFHETMS